MQQRRGLYFQMRRWDRHESGQIAADCSFVRVCGESDDPRLVRMMQGYCEDKLAAAGSSRAAARRTLDPDLEAFLDQRGAGAWD